MTDVELNLKLARMQGESQVSIRAHRFGGNVREVPIDDALGWVCKHNWHLCFDPIHNGADFDAVLMWAFVTPPRMNLIGVMSDALFILPDDCPPETWRRAVCTAIVEAQADD